MATDISVWFWLIAGITLCVMEFTIPTAFVEFTMGISAILVAVFALFAPQLPLQILLFLTLSVALTLLARRIMPKRTIYTIEDAAQGRALTAIPPGKTGRILYEGSSWQARCDDSETAIAMDESVYVVSRQGNTLLVMPERLLYDQEPSRLGPSS